LRRCKPNIFAKDDLTLQYLSYDPELAETFILENQQILSQSFELQSHPLYIACALNQTTLVTLLTKHFKRHQIQPIIFKCYQQSVSHNNIEIYQHLSNIIPLSSLTQKQQETLLAASISKSSKLFQQLVTTMPAEVLNSQIVFKHLCSQNDTLAIEKYLEKIGEKSREELILGKKKLHLPPSTAELLKQKLPPKINPIYRYIQPIGIFLICTIVALIAYLYTPPLSTLLRILPKHPLSALRVQSIYVPSLGVTPASATAVPLAAQKLL
jgi:hypothetical protein